MTVASRADSRAPEPESSHALSFAAHRWIDWVQSGRLFYITTVIPLLTLVPALFALALVAPDTIPLTAPAQTLRFQFDFSQNTTEIVAPPTLDSNAGESPSPPTAPGAQQADPDLLNDYLVGVMGLVDRAKRYPRRERSEQIEGDVTIRMKLDRQGKLMGVQIVQPSPNEGFNRAALAAVRRAAPFPAMPKGVDRERVQLRLRLRFQLR